MGKNNTNRINKNKLTGSTTCQSVKNEASLTYTPPKIKHKLNCSVLKSFLNPKLISFKPSENLSKIHKPTKNKKLLNTLIEQSIKSTSERRKKDELEINTPSDDRKTNEYNLFAPHSKIPTDGKMPSTSAISQFKSRTFLSGEKAMNRLKGSHFRFLNEKLYTSTGEEALHFFQDDPDSFQQYHNGFKQQVSKWPQNPLDTIIQDIQKMPKGLVIADLGCGEAKIAQMFPKRKVHSFDLQPLNKFVTPCDISKVPLENNSVDVAIFCLSLMGTNIKDYLLEAKRILKLGGILKIAEIQSRMKDPTDFVKKLRNMGYKLVKQDFSNKMFSSFEFKLGKRKHKKMSQDISLDPCLYKKR